VLVIEGPHVRTDEPVNTDGRRCLDLIETAFNIPVLPFVFEVFIKESLPRDIVIKVESNPQSPVRTYVHRFAVNFNGLADRK